MDPPGNLLCELRPYQKQALYWMIQMEKGRSVDETDTTLHPCWDAYRLADKYALGYLTHTQTHMQIYRKTNE